MTSYSAQLTETAGAVDTFSTTSFDQGVSATWGEALADLRDKVGGLPNWSIKDDPTGGASSLAHGDYFVITNALGEDFRLIVANATDESGYGGIRGEYGPNWDVSTGSWSDRYSNDPRRNYYDTNGHDTYQDDYHDDIAPLDPADNLNTVNMSDAGRYWLAYADAGGFCFYFQREAGDGSDDNVAIGLAEVNRTWDYTKANNRESKYAYLWAGCRHVCDPNGNHYYDKSAQFYNVLAEGGNENDTGRGTRNPDANFDNYPFINPWLTSTQYTNDSGNTVLCGTHDLWLNDLSGTTLDHGDTVTDHTGETTHTILKKNNVSLAVRNV